MQSYDNDLLPYEIKVDCINQRDQLLWESPRFKSALLIVNMGNLCSCLERSEPGAPPHSLILSQVCYLPTLVLDFII